MAKDKRLDGYRIQTGESAGRLETYAWPGAYPLFYLTNRGDVLCPNCANRADSDPDDPPVAADANWEDPDLYCYDCGERIPSAYAEKD